MIIVYVRRRRDVKAGRKNRYRDDSDLIRVDSSDDEDDDFSDDSRYYDNRRSGKRHDPRSRAGDKSQAEGAIEQDLANLVKSVELKEFQKIVLRRRDLCKWVENVDF